MYMFIYIHTIQRFEPNEDEQRDPETGVDFFCVICM